MSEHEGLPVAGYRPQTDEAVKLVNANKLVEEQVLRVLDNLAKQTVHEIDHRWLAIGRTHIEQGFMAVNRAIFKPERVTRMAGGSPRVDAPVDYHDTPPGI